LRILVDGSYLAASEMGTQVATLATIDALRRRDDVREVVVALAHPIPPYAAAILGADKVSATPCPSTSSTCWATVTWPPAGPAGPLVAWRRLASGGRPVVLTLLDLIAYRIGSYHDSPSTG